MLINVILSQVHFINDIQTPLGLTLVTLLPMVSEPARENNNIHIT